MDTLSYPLDVKRQPCYMASINLTDASYLVPVAFCDQNDLLLKFEWVRHKYVCLENGPSFAPRIFTKILKPVLSILCKQRYQAMICLDDFFLVGDNFEESLKVVQETTDLLSKLEF